MTLAVENYKSPFMALLGTEKVIVIQSIPGSGKTTKLPQYALERRCGPGRVACTQPRRLAAISVARYVAKERGGEVGGEVGYAVRFDHRTSAASKIIYMTEGVLVNEAKQSPMLEDYSVIFIDEAHERTTDTDILLGLLKYLLEIRDDLKVVIMSATIKAGTFSEFFFNCKVLNIEGGRPYPVEIEYITVEKKQKEPAMAAASASVETSEDNCDSDDEMDESEDALCTTAANKVAEIHNNNPGKEHILVVMPGEMEISKTCKAIKEAVEKTGKLESLRIIPLMSLSPDEDQQRAVALPPRGIRKCVVATNIVETSITIEGVAHVIDSGQIRVKCYDFKAGYERLELQSVSKASADQRLGRTGRTCRGHCYRLYSSDEYKNFQDVGTPEVLRVELDSMLVNLKALNVENFDNFYFVDKPEKKALEQAVETLQSIGAFQMEGSSPGFTNIGAHMARIPLEPKLARVLIESISTGVGIDILKLMAMLSAPPCFALPMDPDEKYRARKKIRAKFADFRSDHIMLIALLTNFASRDDKGKDQYCKDFSLRKSSMQAAMKIRQQLQNMLTQMELPPLEDRFNLVKDKPSNGAFKAALFQTMMTGFVNNVARPAEKYYKIAGPPGEGGTVVRIHRSSSLYSTDWSPVFAFFTDCVGTGGGTPTMRNISEIYLNWMPETELKRSLQGIQAAKPKQMKGVQLSGMPENWSLQHLMSLLMNKFDYEIKSFKAGRTRSTALVKFLSNKKAETVVQALSRESIGGVRLDAVQIEYE